MTASSAKMYIYVRDCNGAQPVKQPVKADTTTEGVVTEGVATPIINNNTSTTWTTTTYYSKYFQNVKYKLHKGT